MFIILIAPIFNTLTTGSLHSFILTTNIYEVRRTDITQNHIKRPPSEALSWRLPYKSGTYDSTVWRIVLPWNQNLTEAASNGKLYGCCFQRLLWKRIAAKNTKFHRKKNLVWRLHLDILTPSLSFKTTCAQNHYILLWPHRKGGFHLGPENACSLCFEKQEVLLLLQ